MGEDVGDDVLELADLVAAEGEAAVAVLPLGPDLCTAEVPAETVERVDRTWSESERATGL